MTTSNETPNAIRQVRVSVPATSANLGPGFDCLGLALELRNEVTLIARGHLVAYDDPEETRYEFSFSGIDTEKLPQTRENLLIQAAESIFREVDRRPTHLAAHMHIEIPVSSGLGSSSSAIVAGLTAANLLVDGGLSKYDLLNKAVSIEGHPDNVAPAILGGIVLGVLPDTENGPQNLIVKRIDPPRLLAVVVLPDFHLSTSDARALLPASISRQDAIFNTSRFGLLLYSLITNNVQDIGIAMADRLHQPYRLSLIPGAAAAMEAAYLAGAMGVALSGAGPSLIAFVTDDRQQVAMAMADEFARAGLSSRQWLLDIALDGVLYRALKP